MKEILYGSNNRQYRLVPEPIGAGGFGCVYKAEEVGTGRFWAIKIYQYDEPEHIVKEAQSLMSLNMISDPRIVKFGGDIFTDNSHQGKFSCLLMEFVNGVSLEEYHKNVNNNDQEPIWKTYINLIIAISEAIHSCHEAGLIHRDIKPQNILLRDGNIETPVIVDFGIAREAYAAARSSSRTPLYAPPESISVDHHVPNYDVYSLGATLYSLIANKVEHASRFFKPLHQVVKINQQFSAIISKAMAIDPSQRYQSALKFADALRNALKLSPSLFEESNDWLIDNCPLPEEWKILGRDIFFDECREKLYAATWIPKTESFVVAGQEGLVFLYSRTEPGEYQVNGHLPVPEKYKYSKPSISSLAISPDGVYLAAGDSNQKVTIWEIKEIDSPIVFEPFAAASSQISSLEFSPNSQNLLIASMDGRVQLCTLDTHNQISVFVKTCQVRSGRSFLNKKVGQEFQHLNPIAISSKDLTLFTGLINDEFIVSTLLGENEIPVKYNKEKVRFLDKPVNALVISKNSEKLFASCDDSLVSMNSLPPYRRLKLENLGQGRINALTLTPNDQIIAVSLQDGRIVFLDTNTFSTIRTFSEQKSESWAISFSSNGRLLLSISGTIVRVWECPQPKTNLADDTKNNNQANQNANYSGQVTVRSNSPPVPASSSDPAPTPDLSARIKEIEGLGDLGVLTPEQVVAAKAKLLGNDSRLNT